MEVALLSSVLLNRYSMAGIQFFGVADVVDAYSDYEIDCWAIAEGKDLIKTGDDAAGLTAYLNKLEVQGSAAPYTLRVYRNVEDVNTITAKTDYSACFRFKLNEREGAVGGLGVRRAGGIDAITAKLHGVIAEEVGKVIEDKLNGGREEKEETVIDAIIGLVKQPDKLISVLQGMRGLFVPAEAQGLPPAAYAAVGAPQPKRAGAVTTPVAEPIQAEFSQSELDRLQIALDRLGESDPDIIKHLELLADLAEKDPKTYKMGIKMLS
jgi:hypothetical protein